MPDAEPAQTGNAFEQVKEWLACAANPAGWSRKRIAVAAAVLGTLILLIGWIVGSNTQAGRIAQLEDECALLKQNLEAAEQARAEGQAQAVQSAQELDQVKAKLASAQNNADLLTDEVTLLKGAAKTPPTDPRLEELEAERQRLAAALAEANRPQAAPQAPRQPAAASVKDLKPQLESEQAARKKAEQRLAAIEDEIKKATTANADAAKRDKTAKDKAAKAALDKAEKDLQDQIKQLNADNSSADKVISDLQRQLAQVRNDLLRANQKINNLEDQLARRRR